MKTYNEIWNNTRDIQPLSNQVEEVANLKARFVRDFETWSLNKQAHRYVVNGGEFYPNKNCITIDPINRCVRTGESDICRSTDVEIFKCGPWEWEHLKNFIRSYLGAVGYKENYHNYARLPIGNIQLAKPC